ncbi:MAG: fumarylacetoacetate hydrolase family protein [Planctomycetia bacterium]|nr:fumarylacetoacetate hydrolase family protein [Planctomycetia bacterium]
MRIVRFLNVKGQPAWGEELAEGRVRRLDGDPYGGFRPSDEMLTGVTFRAPVAATNVICIGLNYREHATESGMKFPEHPVVFMKNASSVIGPGEPIVIPACCDPAGEVDYECELAVVIGRAAKNVSEAEALNYVLGYTAANDVSARKWQLHGGGGQWVRGKSFDTFCPLGPALVPAEEITDPQALSVRTVLNGQTVQDHTTGDMIFPIRKLISFLSQDTTLSPGTVILTGTPQGVGFARKPPLWLRAGDVVTVEIERIGKLTNPVVAA